MHEETVDRLAIPYDDAGILITSHFDKLVMANSNKRSRKSVFNQLARVLRFSGLLPKKCEIISIGQAVDRLGNVQVEVLYRVH